MSRSCAVGFLFSILLLASSLSGQTGQTNVWGRISDSAGAVVAGAKIELVPSRTVTRSDNQGNFAIDRVAPGTYTLTASYVGFSIFSSRIEVVAGSPVRTDRSQQNLIQE